MYLRLLRFYRNSVDLELITSLLLIVSTFLAIFMFNSNLKSIYTTLFESKFMFSDFTFHMFVNDFLMAIFFLVAGIEIKHEILYGSLSSFKKASFPVIASIGGVVVPALIFILINKGTPFLSGLCIPISTDIAFAVGVFFLLRNMLNPSLKIFLLSLAVVDDLISILAIGVFYSFNVNITYLLLALGVLLILFIANKVFEIESISYYLTSGLFLWYFIFLSGVHSTISGILLAIVIPTTNRKNSISTLERIHKLLNPLNNLIIIPLFAFANTGIDISGGMDFSKAMPLSLGIILGLCVGKPLGIMLFSYLGCLIGITEKPNYINWLSIFFVSLIAGIGFTMSIFVSEVAFIHNLPLVDIAKISILIASCISLISSVCIITLCNFTSKIVNTYNTYITKSIYK